MKKMFGKWIYSLVMKSVLKMISTFLALYKIYMELNNNKILKILQKSK